jgi:hypothetical protein
VLKKTITYTDFNGEEVSEDFFFHLSKAELVELELSHPGGMSAALERIVASEDGKSIIAEFKNIILGSYGQKSLDGRRFIKNAQLREEFESSEAYSTLFMELVMDAGAAAEFINGIIPQGMVEEAARVTALASVPEPAPETPEPETPAPEEKPVDPKNGDLWADKSTGEIYQYDEGEKGWKLRTNLQSQ